MANLIDYSKELSSEQRADLLSALQARFEKNMPRHSGLEWADVQARLEANPEKLWSLSEMESTGGEPDVVGFDKRRANTCFMTVPPKAPKVAGTCVTTVKRWRRAKNLNPPTAPWISQQPWASKFYPKKNIVSCRNWGISIPKRQPG